MNNHIEPRFKNILSAFTIGGDGVITQGMTISSEDINHFCEQAERADLSKAEKEKLKTNILNTKAVLAVMRDNIEVASRKLREG